MEALGLIEEQKKGDRFGQQNDLILNGRTSETVLKEEDMTFWCGRDQSTPMPPPFF